MRILKTLALLAAAVMVTGQSIDSLPLCSVSVFTKSSSCHQTAEGRDRRLGCVTIIASCC